ncbi:MAG: hypothetical protein LBO74_08475 [Candidatus Symbiothrix sp.]|jgi:hypothetical protein|nr:hypothetical protein [Candidatus Symbiothrix sp.]
MALTTDQEAIVLQIITAFTNGKRLNELPSIGEGNPLDLIVEVLDVDGESKQAKLAALLPYLEEQCAYGIEFDTAVSSPVCTRIGNLAFHRSLPIQNRMRGCLLSDDGTVVEYLHPTNWAAYDRSGARGQVMVEIPAHFRKFETDGTKRRAKISELPLPGYHSVPKKYVSAYEATFERSTGKLCSVVNMDVDYRGGNNQSAWDGTYRSVLGRPTTSKSRTQFRTAARLRGAGTQWNCNDYNAYKDAAWLYYIEYANLNSQAAFNAQTDANGYKQGGLGNGVTTLSSTQWNTLNGYYPFIPCGQTDSLGNFSGEVSYSVDVNGDESSIVTVYANRYRGIENPFGHIWKWTDGINIEVKTDADGGTSKVYVANNPANYIDNGYANYEMRGLEARAGGYVKEMILGEFGEIISALDGGGSTTYWCDNHYISVTSSSLRGVLFGGGAINGAAAGLGCAHSDGAPSGSTTSIGSRLCFIPA